MSDTEPRKVLISPAVMAEMATRDNDGNRLHVDWGEPDADGFYDPVVSVDYTDTLQPAAPAEGLDVRIALWEATIAAHYAEDHQSVMPGDRVDGCTEGRCPEWFALSNALTPEDDR